MQKGIFISYSHHDVDAVEKIVGVIEKSVDCRVWFDRNLRGGEHYFSVIADKILEEEYFIFVVSPYSVTSDFCLKELEFAMSEKRKIIALWLEDFMPPPRVRLVISNTHYIKNYENPQDSLGRLLAQALSAEHLSMNGEEEYVVSEQKMSSGKYFVSPEETEKIRGLLKKERNQDLLACFQPEAAVLLGIAYEMGVEVEKDLSKADFYYHIAAYKGSDEGAYLELSLRLDREKKATPEMIARMNALADGGCLRAMVYWGDEVYLGNWGMERDKATAYRWFKAAADAGHPVAKYFMGFGYRVGDDDLPEDHAIAWMYIWEAALAHFPRAYRQIGLMYEKGQFVEKDLEKAREFFRKAVDCGDGLAVNFQGNLEYREKNYDAAFVCYQQAVAYVEEKDLPAGFPFYNLGWAYEHAQGVEKDPVMAVQCYFKGAEKKHKSCMNRLSVCINADIQDSQTKYDMLLRAAELNCRYAEYFLGRIHEARDTEQDEKIALEYFEKGMDKGCLYCMDNLLDYYSWAKGAKKYADREKALAIYRLYFTQIDRPENKDYLEKNKEKAWFVSNYYCYAVELDIDAVNKKPDKQLALFYFKKALESKDGMRFFLRMSAIADNYSKAAASGMYYQDLPHSEDLAELCFAYIDQYAEYVKQEGKNLVSELNPLYCCYDRLFWAVKDKDKKNLYLERKAAIEKYT